MLRPSPLHQTRLPAPRSQLCPLQAGSVLADPEEAGLVAVSALDFSCGAGQPLKAAAKSH